MTVLLRAEGLGKRLGGRWVLHEISLEVASGEMVGIIGPNGSGKSTLLSCLVGEKKADTGQVWLRDRPLAEMGAKERARQIAVLAQEEVGEIYFTVKGIVEMGRHPHLGHWPWLGERDERIVADVLRQTDSQHLAERIFAGLSGGEKQRVSLARALAQEPVLLVLDEPTAYLDLKYQFALLNWIKQWQASCGLTVIMVLHDLNLAAQYCDRLLVLKQGRIVRQGTPHEVIVPEMVEAVYGMSPIVVEHPLLGVPQVLLTAMQAQENGEERER
ncbi:heme ABC transporter ATP-binding protein [Laceyella tengchongensis]|jgi:iron complex transport system ATP-binding protein|uniref:heme ABC transporter ATP-binding protein n=1 Tax=Laceyella tengchongensis TaxID=574699 RepID=UPI0012B6FD0D|nr:heme ABC transporter ATP-binding protein [Laceyella tengchongensis]